MPEITLTRGLVALVDEDDMEMVGAQRWYARPPSGRNKRWYAYRREGGRMVYLHRAVLGAQRGSEVDHINGDGLDCRRANLRVATRSQNEANKPKAGATSSRYKGVTFARKAGQWRASLMVNKRRRHLGYFDDEAAAARAYDAAALSTWGPFARLNTGEATA